MFESSKDILNYSLALSALVITFLITWIFWYIIGIFRDVHKVIREITKTVEKLNGLVDETKEKIASVAGIIPLVVKSGEAVSEIIRQFREKKASPKSKKTK